MQVYYFLFFVLFFRIFSTYKLLLILIFYNLNNNSNTNRMQNESINFQGQTENNLSNLLNFK